MRFFNIAMIFVYTLVFSVVGAVFIALSLRVESLNSVINMLSYLAKTNNMIENLLIIDPKRFT